MFVVFFFLLYHFELYYINLECSLELLRIYCWKFFKPFRIFSSLFFTEVRDHLEIIGDQFKKKFCSQVDKIRILARNSLNSFLNDHFINCQMKRASKRR